MPENEKRKVPRRKVRIPILCWEVEDGERAGRGREIVSKDLSSNGIGFYSKDMYPIDTVLYIEIFLPSQKTPISCKLKVISIEAGPKTSCT